MHVRSIIVTTHRRLLPKTAVLMMRSATATCWTTARVERVEIQECKRTHVS